MSSIFLTPKVTAGRYFISNYGKKNIPVLALRRQHFTVLSRKYNGCRYQGFE